MILTMFGSGNNRSVRFTLLATLSIATVLSVAVSSAAQLSVRPIILPPKAGQFDYQLGGSYPLPKGTKIVSRDRTDKPATGVYNICYLNAFQTQPGENSWWHAHHPELLLRDKSGHEVADPNWPGEILFDFRTKAKLIRLATILYTWVDDCARHGFDAVEPDNLDSWTRSLGLLHKADNIALARLLTRHSQKQGLAIAQKNTAELASQGRAIGFNFAVAEECQVYNECDAYIAAYGSRVIEIEYSDNGTSAFEFSCKVRGGKISIVLRDRNLTLPADPDYEFKRC
jgi:hypothetical protein